MSEMLRLAFDELENADLHFAGAILSECGLYRYRLWRRWQRDAGSGDVNFIMLNPSTADAYQDDPTIRRCNGFARSWGYSGVVVTNLFAFRATSPESMLRWPEPVGALNDAVILSAANAAALVVCAWGTDGSHRGRDIQVRALLRDYPLHYLRLTKNGQPGHPLYISATASPQPWAQQRIAELETNVRV